MKFKNTLNGIITEPKRIQMEIFKPQRSLFELDHSEKAAITSSISHVIPLEGNRSPFELVSSTIDQHITSINGLTNQNVTLKRGTGSKKARGKESMENN